MKRLLNNKKFKVSAWILLSVFILLFNVKEAFSNVKYYQLKNGVEVIIKENKRNKVIAVETWIKGGSSIEDNSNYGISHLLEHMLFKGTEKKSGQEINDLIKSKGGYFNAATSYDYTKYYIVMPKDHFKTALDIEADILKNTLFKEDDIYSEKNVVLEERKRRLDDPESYLWVSFMKNNSKDYPYRNPIIGYQETIRKIDKEKLETFINSKYTGENIFIVVVGDVKADKVYKEIKDLYEDIPKGNSIEWPSYNSKSKNVFSYTAFKNRQKKTYVLMGYKIPSVNNDDIYALDVLSEIIGGGLSSRLYQRLISNEVIADGVNTSVFSGRYPGYLLVSARLSPEKTKECINNIYNEINNVCQRGVSDEEINSAVSRIETNYLQAREDYSEDASIIGYYNLVRDYKFADEYIENIKKVTKEDVCNAAKKYLDFNNSKLFISYPKHLDENILPQRKYLESAFSRIHLSKFPKQANLNKKGNNDESLLNISKAARSKAKVFDLYGGAKLIFCKDGSLPVVSVDTGRIGGFLNEVSSNNGITNFMQNMIMKGNKKMTRKEIELSLDKLGAKMSPFYDRDKIGLSCYVLTRNFEKAMEIYFNSLFKPQFLEDEIKKTRKQIVSRIKGKEDDMEYYAEEKARSLLFKNTHPYHMPIEGDEENIERINKSDLVKWHNSMYKLNGLVISVTGDIDKNRLLNTINKYLKEVKINNTNTDNKIDLSAANNNVTESYTEREREQTMIVYNCLGPSFNSKDFYPFRLFNIVMNGLGGRIFQELREKEGLVYDAYSYLEQSIGIGIFKIIASCDPKNEIKVRDKIKDLFNDVKLKGVTNEEFNKAKEYYKGILLISMQTNSDRSRAYMNSELLGRGYKNIEMLQSVIDRISKKEVDNAIKEYINFDNGAWVIIRARKGS